MFSKILGLIVPYSSTIRPMVEKIEGGEAIVTICDKRSNRNHLGSVHAIALANLGELASGLAVLSSLPPGTRGIVKSLEIQFLKKARGKITAHGSVTLPSVINDDIQEYAKAILYDDTLEVVSEVSVHWQIGKNK